ncbi:MAG: universal stress protein [Dehalogenimonas sp.]|uniref:Universal stress protein n=1 Tax=Candidatus Dehalogenimonas loeffleri TaxID=3127115 RepID=A0ABZ2J1Q7_9CHLR|nr:universal stress protein [Dehalogenimonas sp.]
MTQIKQVVIPLDGSEDAEITLPYGLALIEALDAKVDLVSVDEGGDTANLFQSYLELLAQRLAERFPGQQNKWQTHLISGKAVDEIPRFMQEQNADLLILSAHGVSGKGASQIGKTAGKMLTTVEKPLLLVKSPAPDQKPLIKKILVPLDGSGIGQAALDMVAYLAPALGAEVVLIQVVEPVRYMPSIDGLGAYTLPINDAEIEEEATGFLNRRAAELREKGISVSTVVKTGAATELINDYAAENGVDLIAMSTHGLSGLSRWVFGSVTEKIVQYGTLPVLVVRPGA